MSQAHLHGGPLDGAVRTIPDRDTGDPPEIADFEHTARDGTWYVQYRRTRQDETGWHYQATDTVKRADEE